MTPLCFCAGNFVPKRAQSTLVLGYKCSEGEGGSYSWVPELDRWLTLRLMRTLMTLPKLNLHFIITNILGNKSTFSTHFRAEAIMIECER